MIIGENGLSTLNRETQIIAFLNAHEWGDAVREPVTADASARSYERLKLNGKKAVLMDAPFDENDKPCPLGSSDESRRAEGYAALAMLAGSDPSAFVCLATALKRRGFRSPKIIGLNLKSGLMLLEDLGDNLYASVLENAPEREEEMYKKAVCVLAAIYRSSFDTHVVAHGAEWKIGRYDQLAYQAEADLFTQWYAPEFDSELSEVAQKEWEDIWTDICGHLDEHAFGLALRDFHAQNIFVLEEADSDIASVGLIDFQDALFAHPSFDLVSLLEDARRDVSPDLIAPLISLFCQEAGIEEDAKFHAAYAVQGAQRNAKILGIFVRLARRDHKQDYLNLIPRVKAHFVRDISHPALAALKAWVKKYTPSILE